MSVDSMPAPPPPEVFSDTFEELLQEVNDRLYELIKRFDGLPAANGGNKASNDTTLFRVIGLYSPSQKREVWVSDFGDRLVKDAITIEARSTLSEEEETEAELRQGDGENPNIGNFHVSWASKQGEVLPSTFGAPVQNNDQALENMAAFFQAGDIEFVEI